MLDTVSVIVFAVTVSDNLERSIGQAIILLECLRRGLCIDQGWALERERSAFK